MPNCCARAEVTAALKPGAAMVAEVATPRPTEPVSVKLDGACKLFRKLCAAPPVKACEVTVIVSLRTGFAASRPSTSRALALTCQMPAAMKVEVVLRRDQSLNTVPSPVDFASLS